MIRQCQLNTLESEIISNEEVEQRLVEIRKSNPGGNVYLLAAKVYADIVEYEMAHGKSYTDYLETYQNAIENFEIGLKL